MASRRATSPEKEILKALEILRGRAGNPLAPNGGPWYTKSVWQMGPVVFILLVFIAMFAGWIPSPLLRIDVMDQVLRQHIQQEETVKQLLRNICRNVAKNDIARDGCDRP